MKKYRVSVQLDREFCGSCIGVTWPGFTIGMATEDGANALAAELNRLDSLNTELDNSRAMHIEAKNAALKRVGAFEQKQEDLITWFCGVGSEWGQMGDRQNWTPQETALAALQDLTAKNRNLNQLCLKLQAQQKNTDKLVTAIRESQQILADYLAKPPVISDKRNRVRMENVITYLLGILDHRDLVTLVNGNSEEATPGEPYLDMLSSKPTEWPHWATHLFRDEDGWQFGKLFTGKAGKAWYDSDTQTTASRLWREENMIDGTLEERPGVTLMTATNAAGQKYVCGLGVGVDPQQFIVEADKVYINGAAIEAGTLVHTILDNFSKIISETQLGKMVTTNHFAPRKIGKKTREALGRAIRVLEEGGEDIGPLNANEQAARRLRKLLK